MKPIASSAPRSEEARLRALSTLRAGESGVIVRVVADAPERVVKLSSLGVMPGADIVLLQKLPAVIVRIAETSIALDDDVARSILVEARDPESGP